MNYRWSFTRRNIRASLQVRPCKTLDEVPSRSRMICFFSHFIRVSLFLLYVVIGSTPAPARARDPGIGMLVDSSEVIVIAQVTRIDTVRYSRTAHALVIECLKGKACGGYVSYRAQPSWVCDASSATLGETVILFLSRGDDSVLSTRRNPDADYIINFSGAGRIAITGIADTDSAAVLGWWLPAIYNRPSRRSDWQVSTIPLIHLLTFIRQRSL